MWWSLISAARWTPLTYLYFKDNKTKLVLLYLPLIFSTDSFKFSILRLLFTIWLLSLPFWSASSANCFCSSLISFLFFSLLGEIDFSVFLSLVGDIGFSGLICLLGDVNLSAWFSLSFILSSDFSTLTRAILFYINEGFNICILERSMIAVLWLPVCLFWFHQFIICFTWLFWNIWF